ncbi:hepatocyte growth factor-regulated tyrosine kinase substrate-like [Achroia grisella]|uniref:hepatocyte growth factor-regulated tyrosine kinase substrate-like n=1 Tax=Achroia grisella TaxID=688607 RepID=UPI0027D27896|nr:hepatocyte growth factor-regulated tyrosine kinase substrate-like [Achroia grisella]
MFRANNFDKLLDKATSNLRLDPDWPTILQICDLIRQNDCSPKYAVAAVKKKLYAQNPHQAMFALLTLESIVKNCGSGVHDEVTSKAFCEMLRDLVKSTQHENLRNKILELIQAWAFAFRNSPKYRAVQDTVNILKAESYKFPPLKESDAMFSADTAPEWADGEVCHRCRVAFSLMVRRHHCRACGQVFCQQCSSKTSTLPKFGIEKEVRVCDACYDKVSRPPTSSAKLEIVDSSNDYGPTQPQKRPSGGGKTAEELQEEEELQLALALSQSEAEQKEKERKTRSHIAPDPTPHHPTLSPTPSSMSASPDHSAQASSELSRYLDRNYWEQRLSRDTPAAPTAPSPSSQASQPAQSTTDATELDFSKSVTNKISDEDAEDKEIDEFIETLKSQIEIFVNRMKSNSSRGRSIANDTSVQTLFMNMTTMHSRLLRYIQQQDDKRVYLESLQDKVNQVRDSRAALDTLRAEHAARLTAQAEAAERQRQMQMAAKLQAMRKKKHEYLQYQRQLALQRVQEQEREMQMRQEQQKHQYMMSNSGYYMPGANISQYQPGYPNQPLYANPQFHPQMMPQATTDASLAMPGQPQFSQANMQMGTISQSVPQLTNTYAMGNSGISHVPTSAQQPMNRPTSGQQLPMQQQMLMHQMRIPVQPGVHQMIPQNIPNGQNVPQQNGQTNQLPKQPNQQQQPPSGMVPPMSVAQQNLSQIQSLVTPNNQMVGMQIPNMRNPMMTANQSNAQVPVSGYPVMPNQQNNQLGSQVQQSQIPIPGQPMMLPGQQIMQGPTASSQHQSIPMTNHIPTNQNAPSQASQIPTSHGHQLPQQSQSQNQPIPTTGQPLQPPNQMMMQGGQQVLSQNQSIPQQGQMLPQNQNIPPHGQINQISPGQMLPHNQGNPQQGHMNQMPPVHMLPGQQGQPLSHGQMQHLMAGSQMSHGPQTHGQIPPQIGQGQQQHQSIPSSQPMSQGQPLPQTSPMTQGQPVQNQSMPQGQPITQNIPGQPMKVPQNFGLQGQGQHAPQNHQVQQVQTSVKSENNNNTAELISFD